MEAKDTLLTFEEATDIYAEAQTEFRNKLPPLLDTPFFYIQNNKESEAEDKCGVMATLLKQAELSFKEGGREVMKWFMTHGYSSDSIHYSDGIKARFDTSWVELQGKLKELGIEK